MAAILRTARLNSRSLMLQNIGRVERLRNRRGAEAAGKLIIQNVTFEIDGAPLVINQSERLVGTELHEREDNGPDRTNIIGADELDGPVDDRRTENGNRIRDRRRAARCQTKQG